jgi:uncharacterized protein
VKRKTFLTAEWRDLVMLNYVVEPALLKPLVPAGTELDFYAGRTFLSVVGFRFLRTRVLGIPFPGHTNFVEVNLRFYIRRPWEGNWIRGVVFIREIVPRKAITLVARVFYGEPYLALPMRHEALRDGSKLHVRYQWKHEGNWHSLEATAQGESAPALPGSEEEFITDHYWGYTARGDHTLEYAVEHVRWRIWRAVSSKLNCAIAGLCGPQFIDALERPPTSAFIADGSKVLVRTGRRIARNQSPSIS